MSRGPRLLPYELKPPPEWEDRVQCMQETPFYLVNTAGPTCYSVRGEDSSKTYKIYIGDRQMCSCGGGKDLRNPQLCIHLIYIMIKVLRTPSSNPLSWQLSLLDSEVTQILQGRFGGRVPTTAASIAQSKHAFLKKRMGLMKGGGGGGADVEGDGSSGGAGGSTEAAGVERHELDPQEVCPICQDEMSVAQALTYCKRSCGNNMHVKCMKMYAEFQRTSSAAAKVTCPLCRVDWGGPIRVDPFGTTTAPQGGDCTTRGGEDGAAANGGGGQGGRCCPPSRFRTTCATCQACITQQHKTFYRCLLCPPPRSSSASTDLCRSCYLHGSGLPPSHHHTHTFAEADLTGGDSCCWRPAPPPPEHQHQHHAAGGPIMLQLLPSHVISSLQSRELGAGDYDMLLELDNRQRQAQSLPHFLLSLLPPAQAPPPPPSREELAATLPLLLPAAASATAGDTTGLEEAAPPAAAAAPTTTTTTTCGICSTSLLLSSSSSSSPLRHLLGCGHVVHESCALSTLLEGAAASSGADGGGEALAALACPTCRQALFPALTLRARKKSKKATTQQEGGGGGGGGDGGRATAPALGRLRGKGGMLPTLTQEDLAGMFVGGKEISGRGTRTTRSSVSAPEQHQAGASRGGRGGDQYRRLKRGLSEAGSSSSRRRGSLDTAGPLPSLQPLLATGLTAMSIEPSPHQHHHQQQRIPMHEAGEGGRARHHRRLSSSPIHEEEGREAAELLRLSSSTSSRTTPITTRVPHVEEGVHEPHSRTTGEGAESSLPLGMAETIIINDRHSIGRQDYEDSGLLTLSSPGLGGVASQQSLNRRIAPAAVRRRRCYPKRPARVREGMGPSSTTHPAAAAAAAAPLMGVSFCVTSSLHYGQQGAAHTSSPTSPAAAADVPLQPSSSSPPSPSLSSLPGSLRQPALPFSSSPSASAIGGVLPQLDRYAGGTGTAVAGRGRGGGGRSTTTSSSTRP